MRKVCACMHFDQTSQLLFLLPIFLCSKVQHVVLLQSCTAWLPHACCLCMVCCPLPLKAWNTREHVEGKFEFVRLVSSIETEIRIFNWGSASRVLPHVIEGHQIQRQVACPILLPHATQVPFSSSVHTPIQRNASVVLGTGGSGT